MVYIMNNAPCKGNTLIIRLLPLQGVGGVWVPFTQGAALGYVLLPLRGVTLASFDTPSTAKWLPQIAQNSQNLPTSGGALVSALASGKAERRQVHPLEGTQTICVDLWNLWENLRTQTICVEWNLWENLRTQTICVDLWNLWENNFSKKFCEFCEICGRIHSARSSVNLWNLWENNPSKKFCKSVISVGE